MKNQYNSRRRRQTIKEFDKKSGLAYIGKINPGANDVVRGFTTSTTHRDDNFSVGVYHDYAISFSDRRDLLKSVDGDTLAVRWLIMTVRLKVVHDLPHFLINSNNHSSQKYARFFDIFPILKPIPFKKDNGYSPEFSQRFCVYTKPSNFLNVQSFVSVELSRVLSAHFWPLSIEQADGYLYLYYDNKNVTPRLLEVLRDNGVWLARYLDNHAG